MSKSAFSPTRESHQRVEKKRVPPFSLGVDFQSPATLRLLWTASAFFSRDVRDIAHIRDSDALITNGEAEGVPALVIVPKRLAGALKLDYGLAVTVEFVQGVARGRQFHNGIEAKFPKSRHRNGHPGRYAKLHRRSETVVPGSEARSYIMP